MKNEWTSRFIGDSKVWPPMLCSKSRLQSLSLVGFGFFLCVCVVVVVVVCLFLKELSSKEYPYKIRVPYLIQRPHFSCPHNHEHI